MHQIIYPLFIVVIFVLVKFNGFCHSDKPNKPLSIIKRATLVYTRRAEPQGQFFKTPFKRTPSVISRRHDISLRTNTTTIRRGKYTFIRPSRRNIPAFPYNLLSATVILEKPTETPSLLNTPKNSSSNSYTNATNYYLTENPTEVSEITTKDPNEKLESTTVSGLPSDTDLEVSGVTENPLNASTTTVSNLPDKTEEPYTEVETTSKGPENTEPLKPPSIPDYEYDTTEEDILDNVSTTTVINLSDITEEPFTSIEYLTEDYDYTEPLQPPTLPEYEYEALDEIDFSENEIETVPVDPSLISYDINCSCGKNHSDYIVGGKPVEIEEFPWMVQLILQINTTIHSFCGGSIINAKYVITAAHCVLSRDPRDFKIRYGHESSKKVGEIANVEKIVIHERYNSSEITIYDIALVKVENDFVYSSRIQSICLLPDPELQRGGVITGWGQILVFGELSDVLKGAFVRILDYRTCDRVSSYALEQLNNKVVCAREEGTDSCQGDSGGPLMVFDASRLSYTLVGVTSWGIGCATRSYPGVYTFVLEFRKWIYENTRDASYCRHSIGYE